jgi:hypothetical protein
MEKAVALDIAYLLLGVYHMTRKSRDGPEEGVHFVGAGSNTRGVNTPAEYSN